MHHLLLIAGYLVGIVLSFEVPLSVVGGIACPYSGTWVADMTLYMKAKFYLKKPKMEEASFALFRKAQKLYQATNFEDFHVLHVSAFEHGVSKLEGFEVAELKTSLYSKFILQQQCIDTTFKESFNFSRIDRPTSSFAFIPFYSKRPAGTVVNKQTHKLTVSSIGQGNSLVRPSVKTEQLLATLCSILKYFEYVVIGVTDHEESALVRSSIVEHLLFSSPQLSSRIAVKVFQIPLPALLPFFLLNWGQLYLSQHNCQHQHQHQLRQPMPYCTRKKKTYWKTPKALSGHVLAVSKPVSAVYYSESDSILVPRSVDVMESVIKALDSSTLVAPVRVEKNPRTAPVPVPITAAGPGSSSLIPPTSTVMGPLSELNLARNLCGKPLCALQVPSSQVTCRNVTPSDHIVAGIEKKSRGGGRLPPVSQAMKLQYLEKLQSEFVSTVQKAVQQHE